ncbi:MAG: phosphonate metabolism protein/1,5-bisphosphokinase (PRPP-forming) PhnN [Pseudomonadota bacterium]
MGHEGPLFAIVGPSGSGKDTLIRWIKERLRGHDDVLFVRRLITRAADDENEDHEAVSLKAFEEGVKDGRFVVHWHAHGLFYALPESARAHVKGGGIAIANGSRAALPEFRKRFQNLHVLHVMVDDETLATRLAARGRESSAEIKSRLARSKIVPDLGPGVIDIDNSGPVERAGQRVLDLIEKARRHEPV